MNITLGQNEYSGVSEIRTYVGFSRIGSFVVDSIICDYDSGVILDKRCVQIKKEFGDFISLFANSIRDTTFVDSSIFSYYNTSRVKGIVSNSEICRRRQRRITKSLQGDDNIRLIAVSRLVGNRSVGGWRQLRAVIVFDSGRRMSLESNSEYPLWLPWRLNSSEVYSLDLAESIEGMFAPVLIPYENIEFGTRDDLDFILLQHLIDLTKK